MYTTNFLQSAVHMLGCLRTSLRHCRSASVAAGGTFPVSATLRAEHTRHRAKLMLKTEIHVFRCNAGIKMGPLGCCSWRLAGTTVLLLAAAVLWPASSPNPYIRSNASFGVRLAAGQGLAVSSELLGAGEAATATQLELFEDSLNIATTGGRGRGGRGGSGGLAASAFTDADRLQQLQRGIYYIAAAPKNFTSCQFKYKWRKRRAGDTALRSDCNNFVPSQPRDQVRCDTCGAAGWKRHH
jgi:hypothetical protein